MGPTNTVCLIKTKQQNKKKLPVNESFMCEANTKQVLIELVSKKIVFGIYVPGCRMLVTPSASLYRERARKYYNKLLDVSGHKSMLDYGNLKRE